MVRSHDGRPMRMWTNLELLDFRAEAQSYIGAMLLGHGHYDCVKADQARRAAGLILHYRELRRRRGGVPVDGRPNVKFRKVEDFLRERGF